MTDDSGRPETTGSPDWLTIDQAAQALDVSAKTIRRRLLAGDLAGEKRFDEAIGGKRWYVPSTEIQTRSGATGLVSTETVAEISALYERLTDAVAEARVAEIKAGHEADRRKAIQEERDTARAEVDRLRAELEQERTRKARRWWQRRP